MEVPYLSVSRSRVYMDCQYKYYLLYHLKVEPEAKKDHLVFGNIVHEALELWYKNDCQDDLIQLYDDTWKRYDLTDFSYYKDGIEMLRNYLSNYRNFTSEVLRDTEGNPVLEYEFELELAPGVILKGVIDRVDKIDDKTIKIIDYKTSRIPLTKEEADNDLQLSTYYMVAREIFPEYPNVDVALNYLRHDEVASTRSDDDAEMTRNFYINLHHQIKNNDDPKPTLNRYCSFCEVKHMCPAYQELISNKDADSVLILSDDGSNESAWEQLQDIDNKIKILMDRKEELENKFRALYERTNQNIIVGDREIYFSGRKMVSYDFNTTLQVVGLDRLSQVVSINKTSVDKLVTPDEKELLEKTAKVSFTKASLRHRKAK